MPISARTRLQYLCMLLLVLGAGCATPSPHYGKFTFSGTVKDLTGKPVPGALVQVRGLPTRTDSAGSWKEEQDIHCWGWDKAPDAFEEQSGLVVLADGFEPYEQSFKGRHAQWFKGCGGKLAVVLDAVLKPVRSAK